MQQRTVAGSDLFVGGEQLREVAHAVQPQLVVAHAGLHQQSGDPILHLHGLPLDQIAITQNPPPVADRSRGDVALRQEVPAQAVGDLAGIDPVVLLFGRSHGPQHQRMRNLHCLSMGQQMIVDPAGGDGGFHSHGARLRKRSDPRIQFIPS